MATFEEIVAAEVAEIAAGDAVACGANCGESCHGDYTCIRKIHPHEPDNAAPHVGELPGGGLVQWVCLASDPG